MTEYYSLLFSIQRLITEEFLAEILLKIVKVEVDDFPLQLSLDCSSEVKKKDKAPGFNDLPASDALLLSQNVY